MIRLNLFACAALACLGAGSTSAEIFFTLRPAAPVDAKGGVDRDLFQIYVSGDDYPSGTATFVLTPASGEPLSLIIYDPALREAGRALSVGGKPAQVSVAVPRRKNGLFSQTNYFARIVPTGGAFDAPVGVNFRRSALPSFTNTAMLPAYRLSSVDGGTVATPPSAPAPVAAAGQLAIQPRPFAPPPTPRSAPAAPEFVSVASRSTPPPATAKMWGALATLDGTMWAEGKDQVLAYRWQDEGRAIEISEIGLWGTTRMRIALAEDGRSFTARATGADGQTSDMIAKPSPAGYILANDDERRECAVSKRAIACRLSLPAGKKWVVDRSATWAPTTPEAGQALLKALPGLFPARAPGKLDARVGQLALISGKVFVNGDQPIVFDVTAADNAFLSRSTMDTSGGPKANLSFGNFGTANPKVGPLMATVATPTGKRTALTSQIAYEVARSGEGRLYYLDGTRTQYAVSIDAHTLIAIDQRRRGAEWQETGRVLYREAGEPQLAGKWGGLGKLPGKIFWRYPGRGGGFDFYVFHAVAPDTIAQILYVTGNGGYQVWTYCLIHAPQGGKAARECSNNGKTSTDTVTEITDTSYMLGTTRYTPNDAALVLESRANPTAPWKAFDSYTRQTFGRFAAEHQELVDKARARALRQEYLAEQREKEANQQAFYNALQGLARSVGADTSNPTAFLQPTDWAARLGAANTSAAANVGGYRQSMGGTFYVPTAPATAEQKRLEDEWQRYQIRRELYSEAQGGFSDAEKAKRASDRVAAEKKRQADIDERIAEDRRRDQREREEADAREAADRAASESGTAVEKQAAAEKRQAADAERAERDAAEKERLAREKTANEERLAAAKKREEDEAKAAQKKAADAAAAEKKRKEEQEKAERMAILLRPPSGDYSPRLQVPDKLTPAAPGQGTMTKRMLGVADCQASSVSARWNLSGIMGEPVVNGTWSWEGRAGCSPPHTTVVWLLLTSDYGHGWVKLDPGVPAAGGGYGYTSAGSPSWNQLICGFRGSAPTACLDERTAKTVWSTSKVVDFQVSWAPPR